MMHWLGGLFVLALCSGTIEGAHVEACNAEFLSKQVARHCYASAPSSDCCKVMAAVFRRTNGVTCAHQVVQEPALKEVHLGEQHIVSMYLKCTAASIHHANAQMQPVAYPAHPAEQSCAPCPKPRAQRCPTCPVIPTPPPPVQCPACPPPAQCPPSPPVYIPVSSPVEESLIGMLTRWFNELFALGISVCGVIVVVKMNIKELKVPEVQHADRLLPPSLPNFTPPICSHCGRRLVDGQGGSDSGRHLLEGVPPSDSDENRRS